MAEEKVIENLPMFLNLGDLRTTHSVIGYASAFRDPGTGTTRIEIQLDAQSSEKLADLAEVFDLKAIGFAGIKRRPQNGR